MCSFMDGAPNAKYEPLGSALIMDDSNRYSQSQEYLDALCDVRCIAQT